MQSLDNNHIYNKFGNSLEVKVQITHPNYVHITANIIVNDSTFFDQEQLQKSVKLLDDFSKGQIGSDISNKQVNYIYMSRY